MKGYFRTCALSNRTKIHHAIHLSDMLHSDHPLIMAPMFLVSSPAGLVHFHSDHSSCSL